MMDACQTSRRSLGSNFETVKPMRLSAQDPLLLLLFLLPHDEGHKESTEKKEKYTTRQEKPARSLFQIVFFSVEKERYRERKKSNEFSTVQQHVTHRQTVSK